MRGATRDSFAEITFLDTERWNYTCERKGKISRISIVRAGCNLRLRASKDSQVTREKATRGYTSRYIEHGSREPADLATRRERKGKNPRDSILAKYEGIRGIRDLQRRERKETSAFRYSSIFRNADKNRRLPQGTLLTYVYRRDFS